MSLFMIHIYFKRKLNTIEYRNDHFPIEYLRVGWLGTLTGAWSPALCTRLADQTIFASTFVTNLHLRDAFNNFYFIKGFLPVLYLKKKCKKGLVLLGGVRFAIREH